MKKEFYTVTNSGKDVFYVLSIDGTSIIFMLAYNSISGGTYYGLRLQSFIDNIRLLLQYFPTFFQEVDDYTRLDEWAVKNGFLQREPTELEILVYGK
jgi:hypothetical protein